MSFLLRTGAAGIAAAAALLAVAVLPARAGEMPGAGGAEIAAGSTLRVRVTGIETDAGAVRINLYESARSFLVQEDRQAVVPADDGGEVVAAFSGLTPGSYAIVVYHDRNANAVLDRGLFGVPLEPLGFSNGVVPRFSRPAFADAAVVHDGAVREIEVRLRLFAAPRAGS